MNAALSEIRALVDEIELMMASGHLPEEQVLQTLADLKNGIFSRGVIVDESLLPPDWTCPVDSRYHKMDRKLLTRDTLELWRPDSNPIPLTDAMTELFRADKERPGLAALHALESKPWLIPDSWLSTPESPKYILFTGDVVRLSHNPLDKKRVFSLCWRGGVSFNVTKVPLLNNVSSNCHFATWKPNATLPAAD